MIPADGRLAVSFLLLGLGLGTWELLHPRRIWPGVAGSGLVLLALDNFQRQQRLSVALAALALPAAAVFAWTLRVRQQKRNRL